MGDTLTTEQIRAYCKKKSAEFFAEWNAKYPFRMELGEHLYEWFQEDETWDLAPQIEEWLAEHAGEEFGITQRTIGFKDADTAFHFRVRWAGT